MNRRKLLASMLALPVLPVLAKVPDFGAVRHTAETFLRLKPWTFDLTVNGETFKMVVRPVLVLRNGLGDLSQADQKYLVEEQP